MRYVCHFCGKSVTSELPDDSVIRALMVCPECFEKGVVTDSSAPKANEEQMNLPFEDKDVKDA